MDAENLLRLDVALPARGLCPSRERAQSLIRAGLVAVNGRPCAKPSTKISEADSVELLGTDHPYVSRGGLKLEKALRVFGADPSGRSAWTLARPPAASPTCCCAAAREGSTPWTWARASSARR